MTPETMPSLFHTGHMVHFLNRLLGEVYTYDPTDDGPECEVITRILANHPSYYTGEEKIKIKVSNYLEVAALLLYSKSFENINEEQRRVVRRRICQNLEFWERI